MRIAIIGTGNVGATLGKLWAALGHDITFGVRDPAGRKTSALIEEIGGNAAASTLLGAVASADTVVLAVPWSAAEEVVRGLGQLDSKVLVDATNPIAPGFELAVGHTTSAAEQIAGWASGGRVVKAFNTLGYEHLANPTFGGHALNMFICGDDDDAKSTVAGLAEELGFEVVDAGAIRNAGLLESLALLWIRLAMVEGEGRDIAFKLISR